MRPDAPPSPPPPRPPLGLGPLLLALVLGAWGVQWAVAMVYSPPERLRARASVVARKAAETPRDLVVIGTCMSEQQIHADLVNEALGSDWTIHNLGGAASGPVDWYLMLKNKLPADAIEGLVVAWIRGDLETNPSVWEGQTMELAAWDDLPRLVDESCAGDPGCALDLGLRKASFVYRYRGFLANWWWTELRARPRVEVVTVSGAPGLPAPVAPPPPPPPPPGLPNPKAEEPALPIGATPAPGVGDVAAVDPRTAQITHAYLRAMLALAQERGIPVWFARMPERADAPDAPPHPPFTEQDRLIRELVTEGGGTVVDLPVLPSRAFLDDRHVNAAGVKLISRALGESLRAELAPAVAPVP